MQQTKIKTIVFLSLFGFFLGIIAISFHHHDKMFLFPACFICKVKTSFSGTHSKIKIDSVPAVASNPFLVTAIILCLASILPNRKNVFIRSQIIETYPNKAPPFSF
jgi:hypothetical protein